VSSATDDKADATAASNERPLLKLALELGPLLLAVGAYLAAGFYAATGVLMVAMTLAAITARLVFGRISAVLAASTLIVLVFGALTLWLHDPRFIKLKPTIVNVAFAAVLFIGLARGRSLLKHLLGEALKLTDEGWRQLTWRWAWFFLVLAGANEVVWRTMSDGAWWSFKAAILPLTMVFFAFQWPLIQRHHAKDVPATDKSAGD
jgi:intracellular septation protein